MNFDDNNSPPPDYESSRGLSSGLEPTASDVPAPGQEYPPPAGLPLPEDLRAPWGWADLFLLVVIGAAGTILIGILLATGFAAFGIKPAQLQNSNTTKSLFLILNQALLSVGLFAYLIAQMRRRFEMPFWQTIGWRPLDTGKMPRGIAYLALALGGFGLSIFVTLVSAAYAPKGKMPIEALFQDRRSAFLLMAMGVTLAPLVEETIFRGYIYPVLARSFGVAAGVIVTGTFFGLMHAPQLWSGWVQIGMLIVVGIVFTSVRALTRTVVASYLLHLSYNSFLFLAFLFASHGLHRLPPVH